ncbi:MAG TPA: AraC family ligand binding domain-containing protein, partial [Bacilli bacterium]
MDSKQPERLTNDQFMPLGASFEIFHSPVHDTTKLHWHEFYEMSFILEGEGIHYLNGISYPAGKGHIFLLTPADFHEVVSNPANKLVLFNVIFTDEWLNEDMRQLIFSDVGLHLTDLRDLDFSFIEAEFRLLWSESRQPKLGSRAVMQSALERIMITLTRACLGEAHQRESSLTLFPQPSIRKALIYMQHHFRDNLTLEDVAKQAQFAPNYFSECFRNTVGTTFQNYLQELRVKFAKSLLSVSQLSVTEICYA